MGAKDARVFKTHRKRVNHLKKKKRESQPLNIQAKGLLHQQENARPIFLFLK